MSVELHEMKRPVRAPRRLTFEQQSNWRNCMRLNADQVWTFAELRNLWHRVKGGARYGQYSGYAP